MFHSQESTVAEVQELLKNVFNVDPRENLHLESTLNACSAFRKLADRLGTKVWKSGLFKILEDEKFITYYKNCLDYFVSDPKASALGNSKSIQVRSFLKLHAVLWNVSRTHCSAAYWICEKLSAHGIHEALWGLVSCRDLVSTKCFQSSSPKWLVSWSFGILLHILNRTQVSVNSYRQCNGVHILRPFIVLYKMHKVKGSPDFLKTCALLLLVAIINEEENKSINSSENYVSYLLASVRVAMKSPDLYSPIHRHHLRDLLGGVNRLSRFDANKRVLLENHILEDIRTLLRAAKNLPNSGMEAVLNLPVADTNTDNLAADVINLLWQLCFLSETREMLPEYPDLIKLCQEFGDARYSKICRETVSGLIWSLANPIADVELGGIGCTALSKTGNPFGHIVFAYSPTHYHQFVQFIKLSLKRRRYSVHEESENTDMEAVLRGASALILCLSYSFSQSPFCRQQVLSALSHGVALVPVLLESNYEAETWLQYLLATVIYTPFANQNFEVAMNQLSVALTKYGIVRDSCDTEVDTDFGFSECWSQNASTPISSSATVKNRDRHRMQFLSESSNESTPTPGEFGQSGGFYGSQHSPLSNTSMWRSDYFSISQPSSVVSMSVESNQGPLPSSHHHSDAGHPRWHSRETSFSEGGCLLDVSWLRQEEVLLSQKAPSEAVMSWDKPRVQQWLQESGLSAYTDALSWLDGCLLFELAWHRIRSADVFFANLERALGMPQRDQVLLFNSLALLADVV